MSEEKTQNQKSKCCLGLGNKVNRQVIIWTTLLGGFFGALVKWGSEVNMPPRAPGEISPPGANIDAWLGWLGINQHSLDYVFQGNIILGAVTVYHWGFCFFFAFVYVLGSMYWKYTRLWFGILYGMIINVVMHWLIIPMLGFRYPSYAEGKVGWMWNMNFDEHLSEFLGHIYWSVCIEVCMIAVLAYFARPIKGQWWENK